MRKITSIIIIICIISIHTIFGQDLRPRTVEVGVIAVLPYVGKPKMLDMTTKEQKSEECMG
jgi:hypothetical protein